MSEVVHALFSEILFSWLGYFCLECLACLFVFFLLLKKKHGYVELIEVLWLFWLDANPRLVNS